MITAVDTCVLLDVLLADPAHGPASAGALRRSLAEGKVVACGPVVAEVASLFPDDDTAAATLDGLTVEFQPLSWAAALRAGSLWRRYRERGGTRRRVVADFLIGAHALVQTDRLLTRDRGFYRDYFDDLVVLAPDGA